MEKRIRFFIPVITKVSIPLNRNKKPIGSKKKYSCRKPSASTYSGVKAFIKMHSSPIHSKADPMIIEIIFIFAFLFSLPSLISFLVISSPPRINSSSTRNDTIKL